MTLQLVKAFLKDTESITIRGRGTNRYRYINWVHPKIPLREQRGKPQSNRHLYAQRIYTQCIERTPTNLQRKKKKITW